MTLAQLAVVRAFCATSLVDALRQRPVTLAQAAPGGRPPQLLPTTATRDACRPEWPMSLDRGSGWTVAACGPPTLPLLPQLGACVLESAFVLKFELAPDPPG